MTPDKFAIRLKDGTHLVAFMPTTYERLTLRTVSRYTKAIKKDFPKTSLLDAEIGKIHISDTYKGRNVVVFVTKENLPESYFITDNFGFDY